MLYGSDTWPPLQSLRKKLDVIDMEMLRLKCSVSIIDCAKNSYTRGDVIVPEISNKIQEMRNASSMATLCARITIM